MPPTQGPGDAPTPAPAAAVVPETQATVENVMEAVDQLQLSATPQKHGIPTLTGPSSWYEYDEAVRVALRNSGIEGLLAATPARPLEAAALERWTTAQGRAQEVMVCHVDRAILRRMVAAGYTMDKTAQQTYRLIRQQIQFPVEARVHVTEALSRLDMSDFSSVSAFILKLDTMWYVYCDSMGPAAVPEGVYVNFVLLAVQRGRPEWYEALVLQATQTGWPTRAGLLSFLMRQGI